MAAWVDRLGTLLEGARFVVASVVDATWRCLGVALGELSAGIRFSGAPNRTTPPTVGDEIQLADQAYALTRLVQGAAAWSLHHPTCLHRSLTLWWLLGRQGIASELRIGVRKEQGRFEAHAWVEYQGMALNDGLDVGSRFAAFQSFDRLHGNL